MQEFAVREDMRRPRHADGRPAESPAVTWRLVPEGRGTRLLLEHTGFDLQQKRGRDALDRMGPGWRDVVLPRLAEVAADPRV